MYTIVCEEPNCVKCRQASEGQSSEKVNQNEILMSLEELVSKDLLLASNKRALCLESCKRIKDQIHYQISSLIGVLRERERDLCTQVEQECCTQMAKIDRDGTVQCIDKLLKRNSESEKTPCRTQLVFTCEYHLIFSVLKKFGQLSYEDSVMHLKQELQTLKQDLAELAENTALSTIPLISAFEAPSMADERLKNLIRRTKDEGQLFEEGTDSMSHKKVGKDSSSDEDDMEIISRSEAATIPSELPALPPKNRFRFARKRSCFPSLYSKKPLLSRENNSASECSVCSEIKSKECVTASIHPGMCDLDELPSFNEQASQEYSSKCFVKSESSIILEDERKEFPSLDEPLSQESSSTSHGNSDAEGRGRDPSVALRSSFTKYLEKNRDGEWLVPEKSFGQLLSSGNNCIFNRQMPFLVENLDQWLSK